MIKDTHEVCMTHVFFRRLPNREYIYLLLYVEMVCS